MAEKTISDIRADYFHPGRRAEQIVETPGWNATRVTQQLQQVSGRPGLLGGVLVQAGTADLTVEVFDEPGTQAPSNLIFRLTVGAGSFDGFADFPIRVSSGIIVRLSAVSAEQFVFVYWR